MLYWVKGAGICSINLHSVPPKYDPRGTGSIPGNSSLYTNFCCFLCLCEFICLCEPQLCSKIVKKIISASVGFEPTTLSVHDTRRFAARAKRHDLENKNADESSILKSTDIVPTSIRHSDHYETKFVFTVTAVEHTAHETFRFSKKPYPTATVALDELGHP